MKNLIIYASYHHNNSLKLVNEVKKILESETASVIGNDTANIELDSYEIIGFASGIYYGKAHKKLLEFIENLPSQNGKKAFVIISSGVKKDKYTDRFIEILKAKGFNVVGTFHSIAHDSFGPLRFIGGVNKGRPNEEDLENAREFAREIAKEII